MKPVLFGMSCLVFSLLSPLKASTTEKALQKDLWLLEKASGGRLGFYAKNLKTSELFRYRSKERFPMGSTFKVVAVGAALYKNLTEPGYLHKKIMISAEDIRKGGYSPVTRDFINKKMTIEHLCEASITSSDNTATNLIMKTLNGPGQITQFARSLGDHHFRLDRWEPDLNSAIPGDLRDTSTPEALALTLTKLSDGSAIGPEGSNVLIRWLKENKTGQKRIRAGVPAQWIVGDKTGTGFYGTTNDIGILWLPDDTMIALSILYTQKTKGAPPKRSGHRLSH